VPSVVSQATKQPTGGIHQETVSSLEARNHKLSKELDVAKKELDATKVEVDASKEEIAARIQYGEKITRELRTSIEENSRLQDTIEKDEEEKKQLQTKLMVAQMKLRDKGVEYDALQIKFQKPMEYLAASSGTLHKEIKSTELQDEILLAKIEKRVNEEDCVCMCVFVFLCACI
jgi:predicted RNase H-like nuclease (RuvC/YqgF family)